MNETRAKKGHVIFINLGKPQKSTFFSGPATKALPLELRGHIFGENFLELKKKPGP